MADGKQGIAIDEARPKRRRLPGVNLRAGSVKQARLESGLSLAQLGKGHVTAPAIYLIETGRTRPSLPTLEHIARRTGKPVEFFLAEPATTASQTSTSLLLMQLMAAEGRTEEAIRLGRSLLEQQTSGYGLGSIRFSLAQAYLNSSEPDLAEPLLAEARSHFEAVGDGPMTAACIGAQAALATIRHSKEAAPLARQALELCEGLEPRPFGLELRLYGLLAAAHMELHEWDAAIEANTKVIEIGGPLLDAAQLATAFSALGQAYMARGKAENAGRYMVRAIGLLDLLRDRTLLSMAENDIGLAKMARRDLAGARPHLERALGLTSDADMASGRGRVLLSLARLSMEDGEVDGAAHAAHEALRHAEGRKDGVTAAEAHLWLGRIADRRGENDTADREFEQALLGYEALGMHDRLLHTHGVYAEVLERRGEFSKAYEHMKRALEASRPPSGRHQEGARVTSA